ncbi:hypothetical protein TELCIR_00304 [Teladorsagia circumcincta]|uniref:Uncharacterized protein n=1 Tax=Teladorsagia circumcincta TaxID=45464 RepID=A0A2G9V522_TELCI|nr:hypothetical protein TELCIR_00304 [Teladorsagia circumcincta]
MNVNETFMAIAKKLPIGPPAVMELHPPPDEEDWTIQSLDSPCSPQITAQEVKSGAEEGCGITHNGCYIKSARGCVLICTLAITKKKFIADSTAKLNTISVVPRSEKQVEQKRRVLKRMEVRVGDKIG